MVTKPTNPVNICLKLKNVTFVLFYPQCQCSVRLSINLFIYLSVYLFIYLSIYLSVYLNLQ